MSDKEGQGIIIAEEAMEYDESSFPGKAESEDEDLTKTGEPSQCKVRQDCGAELVKTMDVQHSISSDMLCSVCCEVLVDPCSLHCGHSFCLLCLASLWKTMAQAAPNKLKCPVCRESWGSSYPGVNIQLRNIIQREYGGLVDSRRSQVSDTDKVTLLQYQLAKKKPRPQAHTVVHRIQQRWIWLALIVITGIAVVLCGMFVLLATSMTGPAGEYMRKPVEHWTHDDVMAWVGALGNWAHHNVSHALQKEKISGAQLLLLDRTVLKSFGLEQKFQVDSLLIAVQELKDNSHSSPRNYHEFLAAHRKATLVLAVLYKMWPRLSFLYAYVFEYYDVFLPIWHYTLSYSEEGQKDFLQYPSQWQLVMFGVEIFLVPHYIVGMCAWYWSGVHKLLSMALLLHCMWSTQQEAKQTIAYLSARPHHMAHWGQETWLLMRRFFYSLVLFVITVVLLHVLWPIVPYFLCDWGLNMVIWHTAFSLAFKPLKKFVHFRRIPGIRRPQQPVRPVRPDLRHDVIP